MKNLILLRAIERKAIALFYSSDDSRFWHMLSESEQNTYRRNVSK
jgi:hypothetical protein